MNLLHGFDTHEDFFEYLRTVKGFDPVRLTQAVAQAGYEWSDANAAAEALEESSKRLRAQLVLEHTGRMVDGKRLSTTAAELHALADARYVAHCDQMVEARRVANRKRVRYDMGKMYLELQRSLQATLRQEMHMTKA